MKKSIIIVIVIVILGFIVWTIGNKGPNGYSDKNSITSTTTVSVPVTETTKISDKLSEYKNEELGFSVRYPSSWESVPYDAGISFVGPADKTGNNTIGKLEIRVNVNSGKCAFPPVATIKERKTVTLSDKSFNMISMSNSVQGRSYFDRMYSFDKEGVCYMFGFSSITLNPLNKGYKGSTLAQVTNNNKAIVQNADETFTNLVKSFTFIVGEQGIDETKVVPIKK